MEGGMMRIFRWFRKRPNAMTERRRRGLVMINNRQHEVLQRELAMIRALAPNLDTLRLMSSMSAKRYLPCFGKPAR